MAPTRLGVKTDYSCSVLSGRRSKETHAAVPAEHIKSLSVGLFPPKPVLVVLLAERYEQTRTHRAVFPVAPCPNMSCWSRYSCSRTAELEGEREGRVRKVLTGRKVRSMHELRSTGALVLSDLLQNCARRM